MAKTAAMTVEDCLPVVDFIMITVKKNCLCQRLCSDDYKTVCQWQRLCCDDYEILFVSSTYIVAMIIEGCMSVARTLL